MCYNLCMIYLLKAIYIYIYVYIYTNIRRVREKMGPARKKEVGFGVQLISSHQSLMPSLLRSSADKASPGLANDHSQSTMAQKRVMYASLNSASYPGFRNEAVWRWTGGTRAPPRREFTPQRGTNGAGGNLTSGGGPCPPGPPQT